MARLRLGLIVIVMVKAMVRVRLGLASNFGICTTIFRTNDP